MQTSISTLVAGGIASHPGDETGNTQSPNGLLVIVTDFTNLFHIIRFALVQCALCGQDKGLPLILLLVYTRRKGI